MGVTRYTVSLDSVQDAEYIRRLELELNKSAVIREAIIAHYTHPTATEIVDLLNQLLDTLRRVEVVRGEGGDRDQAEPARARANLNRMKERFQR